MKSAIQFTLAALIIASCTNVPDAYLIKIAGPAQGTTYHISYVSPTDSLDLRTSIDSILFVIDQSMSLWNEKSTICRLNRGDSIAVDSHFLAVLDAALAVSKQSEGAFDVTLAPLISAWGFGTTERLKLDSAKVDSLRSLTGYQKVKVVGKYVQLPKYMQLDFNAIAQGYSVDVLAEFIASKGIKNYLVEVGGEVRACGKNIAGKTWSIGVDKPEENLTVADQFQVIVALDSASLATSGNYRKFWVDEETGVKYAHTIDPKTGYPVKSRLLSASIIAADCMTADAWATACMVVGLEIAKEFISDNPQLEGYLVYSDLEGKMQVWQSDGFAKMVL